ncbi:hypothetical protein GCM10027417_28190 [Glutamicibacter endophyticus]
MSEVTVFESSGVIRLSVARVWELLTDWVSMPLWAPGVQRMQPAEDRLAPGLRLDYLSAGHERQLTVHEVDPEKRLVLRTGDGPDSLAYSFSLDESAGQAKMLLRITVLNPDLSSAELADLAEEVAKRDGATLYQLKLYAESAP